MRASMRLAQLAVLAAALSVAGCAAGAQTPTTPHVAVSISAPTSGATVGVHKVTITGTVIPAGAQVAVNGQPAKVKGSTFTTTMYVASADQKIVVSGVAHGYVPAQTTATVSYSPNVAKQLVAAAASATAPPVSTAGKVPASVITQAFGVPATGIAEAGPVVGGSKPTPVSSQPSGGSHNSSPSGSGSGTPTPSGSAPTSTPPSSTPTPPPAPTPAQIAAAIHVAWDHGCVRVRAGGDVTPYCTCTYNHLAGQLQTPAAGSARTARDGPLPAHRRLPQAPAQHPPGGRCMRQQAPPARSDDRQTGRAQASRPAARGLRGIHVGDPDRPGFDAGGADATVAESRHPGAQHPLSGAAVLRHARRSPSPFLGASLCECRRPGAPQCVPCAARPTGWPPGASRGPDRSPRPSATHSCG